MNGTKLLLITLIITGFVAPNAWAGGVVSHQNSNVSCNELSPGEFFGYTTPETHNVNKATATNTQVLINKGVSYGELSPAEMFGYASINASKTATEPKSAAENNSGKIEMAKNSCGSDAELRSYHELSPQEFYFDGFDTLCRG